MQAIEMLLQRKGRANKIIHKIIEFNYFTLFKLILTLLIINVYIHTRQKQIKFGITV